MTQIEQEVQSRLFALQDVKYRAFQCKLMPTVNPDTVIGVRTPALRALAKELSKTPQGLAFCQCLPHRYYDENNLHGFVLETMKDYDQVVALVNAFLPYVDNWATCDLMCPKVFARHLPELLGEIRRWLASPEPYTIRFGVEMLMSFYLDDAFQPEYLTWVGGLRSQEYYVNMMLAWYFATALAKQYDAALPYLTERRLAPWVHNKTIQKAVESYRITPAQKALLKTLKLK